MYSINLSTVGEKSAGVAHTSAEVAACFTYPVRPQIATECANPLTPRHRQPFNRDSQELDLILVLAWTPELPQMF